MTLRLRLALLNAFRNARRSLLNVLMIAGGISAIVVFEGFSHHQVDHLRDILIASESGHIQIARPGFWDGSEEVPMKRMLAEPTPLADSLRSLPHVKWVSGRLTFFGMLSAHDRAIAGRILAFDPSIEKDSIRDFILASGAAISSPDQHQAMFGAGLASQLGVKPGDQVTLLANTVNGVANAVDAEVTGTFNTGLEDVDNTTVVLPLRFAQVLLDTEAVDKLILSLDDTLRTWEVKAAAEGHLAKSSDGLVAKAWNETSKLFTEVVDFYAVYNGMMSAIILSLVLVGILNTVGMSIFERTGEIGTLGSLGEPRRALVFQFGLEGLILGAVGSLAGTAIGIVAIRAVNAMKILLTIPGASVPVLMKVDTLPSAFLSASLLSIAATLVASLIPASRATRMPIVDALRRNI